jgi:hypothetical protein
MRRLSQDSVEFAGRFAALAYCADRIGSRRVAIPQRPKI